MKILLICLLIVLAGSVPYEVFLEKKGTCGQKRGIFNAQGKGSCEYDIFGNNTLQNQECGRDYYKSLICETTFQDCTDLNPILNKTAEYPLVCYNCWVKSPTQSSLYKDFQDCISSSVWESNLLPKLFILIAIFAFATLL